MKEYLDVLSGVFVGNTGTKEVLENTGSAVLAVTLDINLRAYGYKLDTALISALSMKKERNVLSLCSDIMDFVKDAVGANVRHKPMYPNFPQSVIHIDEAQLYFNALIHYLTGGTYFEKPCVRPKLIEILERQDCKEIKLLSQEDIVQHFNNCLASKDSLTAVNRNFVVNECSKLYVGQPIPFKETRSLVATQVFKAGHSVSKLVSTATGVLRLATSLSGGDETLKTNSRFKSFKRVERRKLLEALEEVVTLDDVKRHDRKWIKLFHGLHVGDYANAFPKSFATAQMFRKGNVETHATKISESIKSSNVVDMMNLLKNVPSMYVRTLDKMVRSCKTEKQLKSVEDTLSSIVDKVETKVVIQCLGYLKNREQTRNTVVVTASKSMKGIVRNVKGNDKFTSVKQILESELRSRVSDKKVFIDPELELSILPSQARSFSEGVNTYARGTRIKTDIKNTIRMFCYWIGRDIDLSAFLLDDDFNKIGEVAYYDLRNTIGHHSGDITNAPNGASEFIDINIDAVKERYKKSRYLGIDLRVFSGPVFKEHEKCFVGFMERSKPNSGEIYEPSTVKYKIDVVSESETCIPVLFDLQTSEIIWLDLSGLESRNHVNNLANNYASVRDIITYFTNISDYKLTISEIVDLMFERVEDPEEADFVVDVESLGDSAKLNSFFL